MQGSGTPGVRMGSGKDGTTFPGWESVTSEEGLLGSQASLAAPPHTCTSQSITLLSQPPEASCFESWLKLTVSTLRW